MLTNFVEQPPNTSDTLAPQAELKKLQPMPKTLDDFRQIYVFNGDKQPTPTEMKLYRVITVVYTLIA